ncbi:MAG: tetratricopeptide repeat protein [Prevotella sp.]|nr:tetratricopeptide repeat protein [Prevotella sp.]
MDLIELTKHPERMDRDTLYELRSQVALYPYHQTLRLLMLQNLYLLHDPGFDEELRRAAIYITDRRVLFNLVEAAHYQHPSHQNTPSTPNTPTPSSRTTELINSFLDTIPQEEAAPRKRRPTPADAAIDYVAYLLDTEGDTPQEETESVPEMRGQNLIDTFINADKGRFALSDVPLPADDTPKEPEEPEEEVGEEYFTETLARIYIKQGRYSKALEIIRRLSLQVPKKNAYFADQIRFLEKVIINNSKK